MDPEFADWFQEIILDHDTRPRNFRALPSATHHVDCYNPLCGDSYTIHLQLENTRIEDIAFEGFGCAVSKASISMMSVALAGKTVEEACGLFQHIRDAVLGDSVADENALGELAALTAVRNAPTRIRCALLGWDAVRNGLEPARDHQ